MALVAALLKAHASRGASVFAARVARHWSTVANDRELRLDRLGGEFQGNPRL